MVTMHSCKKASYIFSFLQLTSKLHSAVSFQEIFKYINLLSIKNTEHMNLGSLPEKAASNWLVTNFYQKYGCKKIALLKRHTVHSFHEKVGLLFPTSRYSLEILNHIVIIPQFSSTLPSTLRKQQ